MTESVEPRIVVLGIGNILLSDEGVGVHAVNKLLDEWDFPSNVDVYDGGVTGMMGLLPIIEDADRLIVIDAVNMPGEPGFIKKYSLEDFRLVMPKKLSAHDIGFLECLAITEVNGKMPESVTVIGIKPADMETPNTELSDSIQSKLSTLVALAIEELKKLGVEPVMRKIVEPVT